MGILSNTITYIFVFAGAVVGWMVAAFIIRETSSRKINNERLDRDRETIERLSYEIEEGHHDTKKLEADVYRIYKKADYDLQAQKRIVIGLGIDSIIMIIIILLYINFAEPKTVALTVFFITILIISILVTLFFSFNVIVKAGNSKKMFWDAYTSYKEKYQK